MKPLLILAAAAGIAGCSQAQEICVVGSDSMVQFGMALAEEYREAIEVSGGGTGIGLAALLNGSAQIAMSAREAEPEEVQKLTEKFGGPPVQTVVAFESLAVFVHKANPVERISLDELRGVYIKGGTIDDWKQLGGGELGAIVRFNRLSNSGTHHHFKIAVADAKAAFKNASTDFAGSQDIVDACAKNPAAICYAAFSYSNDGVKALAVARERDGKPVLPTPSAVRDGSYPLGRKLYFITSAKADAATKKFVAFVTSPKGQKVAANGGLVSLRD